MLKVTTPKALLAVSGLALTALSMQAGAQGYLTDAGGGAIKDAYNLCWRTGYWTPAQAIADCDPDLVPRAAPPAPPPPPVAKPAPPPPPPPPAPVAKPAPPPKPVTEKVTFAADVFFDFDKSVLKPEGKARLDDLTAKTKGVTLEVIIAIGHTDAVGGNEYNQKLSVRRAEAVKAYLVSKGIEPNRIYTEGKGKTQPIADNRTDAGRAKNRRTEIEVVGTRTKPAG
jgi:OOP family OmpA-OmpF porin